MEEEKKQELNQGVKKFDLKKYIPIIGGALAAVIVIIVLVSTLGGGPKKAVKGYISGLNKRNAKKIVKNIDVVGIGAWGYYDVDDFSEDDYEEFIEEYEDMYEEVDEDEMEDEIEDMIDSMDDTFDYMNDYKSFKYKIEEFKEVEKLGKDLYAVDAKISIKAKPEDKDDDEIDESSINTFIVYKNKLISLGSL